MRDLPSLLIIGFAAVLSGCGGSSTTSPTSTTNIPTTFSIGGTLAGLSGTVVLQNNGGDNLSLSADGPFAFSITLQPNSSYDVTVATQPANQSCTVTNGKNTAGASVTNITVVCQFSSATTELWTWVGGSNYVNAAGVYGTQGAFAASNTPGARRQPITWTDTTGHFWLFGGNSVGNVGMLDDLWEYNPSTTQWAWQGGSNTVGGAASYGTQGTPAASNNPGARGGAAKWTDASGNLWLFGGDSLAGSSWTEFGDLWEYNVSSLQWTWVDGSSTAGVTAASSVPPARTDAISWVDGSGIFWLFGGAQLNSNGSYQAVLNDLWSYNPAPGQWTQVGASTATPNGVYGTQGSATPTNGVPNVPGARMGGTAWLDASGNVWLFGGYGYGQGSGLGNLNDLWKYSPSSGLWTWIGGSSSTDAAGIYGTQRAATVGNGPGARVSAVSWKDSSGNFWLFGGYGYAQGGGLGNLNDLWEYSPSTGLWTWISGSSSTGAYGTYGTQGVAAGEDTPGAREQAAGWVDSSGNFWLFGGFGFDSYDVEDDLNDLWRFAQSP